MNKYVVHFHRYMPLEIEAGSVNESISYAIERMKYWGYSISRKDILNVEFIEVLA